MLFAIEGLVVGLALNLRPGREVAVTVRNAGRGRVGTMLLSLSGRALADLLPLAALGAAALARPGWALPGGPPGVAFGLLAGLVAGVAGWRLMDDRSGGTLHRDGGRDPLQSLSRNPVWDRLAASFSSPGWYLFWCTAGLYLVLEAVRWGVPGLGTLAGGVAAGGIGWHLFVTWRLASPGRDWGLSDRQFRVLTSLVGLLLVALGLRIAATALSGSGIRDVLGGAVEAVFG